MYFCNIGSFIELIKFKPKIIQMADVVVDGRGLPQLLKEDNESTEEYNKDNKKAEKWA